MKRIFRSKMVTVLAVILIVLLPSCQTTEPVDIADVPAIVLPTLPAAAEAAAPEAEETQPEGEAAVSDPALTLDYLGYTVSVTAADGYAEIIYPEAAVTVSDAQAFLLYEAEKYGDEVSGVVYDVSVPGTIMLTYPEGIPEETRYGFASSFLEDIVEYVEMLYPAEAPAPAEISVPAETICYDVLGYTAEFTVEDGKTTLALPPVVIESDVDGFFAYEVAKYGSYVDGIRYSYTGDAVELTYPETISRDDVKANLPAFVDDIAEYAATLAVPAVEPGNRRGARRGHQL